MRKMAVLSDIHGNILALEKVVAELKRRRVDGVFNLGDHVSGPLWPQETIRYLMAQDWTHILGNHDRHLIRQNPESHGPSDSYAFRELSGAELDWLRALPAGMDIENELFLTHGTPSSDSKYLLETIENGRAKLATPDEILKRLGDTKFPVILCGHTHIPRVVEVSGSTLIVNPGSVGLPAYEEEVPEHHVMETGSPHARYAILEHANGRWQAETIAVPYEHEKAAAQAHRNGRLDWEAGLLTGFMK